MGGAHANRRGVRLRVQPGPPPPSTPRQRGGPHPAPSHTRPAAHAPSLRSSLARCASPRVHAKMLATGLVDVGLPFWNSRQWRVTVPAVGKARQGGGQLGRCAAVGVRRAGEGRLAGTQAEGRRLHSKQPGLLHNSQGRGNGGIQRVLTMRRLRLDGLSIRGDEDRGHETQGPVPLSHNVRLHVAVIVLRFPRREAWARARVCVWAGG